jgi:hypothetical protein
MSPWFDIVQPYTSFTNDGCLLHHRTSGRVSSDQDSTTLAKETLEIRTHIAEILANSQSEDAMGDVGAWDSSVDQIFGDEPPTTAPVALNELGANSLLSTPPNPSLLSQPLAFQHSHDQSLAHEYGFLSQPSVGVDSTLPDGTDLHENRTITPRRL